MHRLSLSFSRYYPKLRRQCEFGASASLFSLLTTWFSACQVYVFDEPNREISSAAVLGRTEGNSTNKRPLPRAALPTALPAPQLCSALGAASSLPCLLRFAWLGFAAGHVSRQHAHGLAVGQKRLGQKRHLRGAGPHRLADYLGSYDSTAVSTSALCAFPIRLQHGVLGTKRGTKGTDRGCPGSWSHTCDGMPHV